MPKLKVSNRALLVPPLGTIALFFIVALTSQSSSVFVHIIGILFGVFGIVTMILAALAFYFTWKMRKQKKGSLPFILSILLLLSIKPMGIIMPGIAVAIFVVIALMGIYARSRLDQPINQTVANV